MNIQLEELGTTLAIGLYLILAVVFVLLPHFRSAVLKIEEMRKNIPHFFVVTIIAAGVSALSVGILMEQLSDKYFDSLVPLVDSESEIRTATIFNDDGSLTPLGIDLYRENIFHAFGYETTRDIKAFSNDLYFYAKNRVFDYETYFEELRDTQVRINFMRSFAAVSILLFLLAIFRIVSEVIALNKSKKGLTKTRPLLVGVLVFLFFSWAGLQGYQEEETQFDRRVYGYFESLVASGREVMPQPKAMPPPRISGLTALGNNRVAVVDVKDRTSNRVFWVIKGHAAIHFVPFSIEWGEHRVPTDLEGICNDGSSLWVMESSIWDGRAPRLLEIKNNAARGWNADRVLELPDTVTNLEGLECMKGEDGRLWFLLGERGENRQEAELIRAYAVFGNACEGNEECEGTVVQESKHTFTSPLAGNRQDLRHISDLAIISNVLFVASARDGGDLGPFESSVTVADFVGDNMNIPAQIDNTAWVQLQDIKVEGIARGWVKNAMLAGADNENLGGGLRSVSIRELNRDRKVQSRED